MGTNGISGTKKVYKALMEVGGRLESLTTLGANLTYTEGEITYAPEGSMGIFVEETLMEARSMGQGNRGYKEKEGKLVVYEAAPLGFQEAVVDHNKAFGNMLRYPAILLGKEVWRDKPKEPTELERLCEARTLLGGDIRTCNRTSLNFCPEGRKYALYFNRGEDNPWVLYEGNRGKVMSTCFLQRVKDFVKHDEPKEEWVDITNACNTQLTHGYDGAWLSLMYSGAEIGIFGVAGWQPWGECAHDRVKIEPVGKAYPSTGGFKVLKKVV